MRSSSIGCPQWRSSSTSTTAGAPAPATRSPGAAPRTSPPRGRLASRRVPPAVRVHQPLPIGVVRRRASPSFARTDVGRVGFADPGDRAQDLGDRQERDPLSARLAPSLDGRASPSSIARTRSPVGSCPPRRADHGTSRQASACNAPANADRSRPARSRGRPAAPARRRSPSVGAAAETSRHAGTGSDLPFSSSARPTRAPPRGARAARSPRRRAPAPRSRLLEARRGVHRVADEDPSPR